AARCAHRGGPVLGLVRPYLGVLLGALRGPSPWRVVPHPHARQPEILGREEPRGEGRLPHDGRVLGGAERRAVTGGIAPVCPRDGCRSLACWSSWRSAGVHGPWQPHPGPERRGTRERRRGGPH